MREQGLTTENVVGKLDLLWVSSDLRWGDVGCVCFIGENHLVLNGEWIVEV